MQQLKPVLKLYVLDVKYSFMAFWSILLASSLLTFLLALTFPEAHFGISGNVAVYVYLSIAGFLMTKETLPFALGMNSTRFHYYWGMVIGSLGLVLISVLFLNFYILVFDALAYWFKVADRFTMSFILSDALLNNRWLTMFSIDFVLGLFVFSLFSLVGAAYYRFGWIPLLGFVVLCLILIMTPVVRQQLGQLFGWVMDNPFLHAGLLLTSLQFDVSH